MQELKNPGFEEETPNNWQTYSSGTKQIYAYPDEGRIRGLSVAIEYPDRDIGKLAMWTQNIKIDHTKRYKLSGWMRTLNIIGSENTGARIKVDWKDGTGKYIGTSKIMAHQKGTIPWTLFEGIVDPYPNAQSADICLTIYDCSGKVWFDDMSFSYVVPTIAYPNIYLNQNDIDVIKSRINQEPWKSAYNKLMNEYVPNAMNTPIQTVVNKGSKPPSGNQHDYYTESYTPDKNRTDYFSAMALCKAVRDLGLAYTFTSDQTKKTQYANKVIQLINGWCVNPSTRMNPRFTKWDIPGISEDNVASWIELSITIPGIFYGADLIWDYPGWNSADKNAFISWTRDMIVSGKGWHREQNFENWRMVFLSSASVITGDSDVRNYAFEHWKELIPLQMDTRGRMIEERKRKEKSLFYSTYAVNAMIQTAEIARHYGVDLYNYKLADGRGLEKALDYHIHYLLHPEDAIPPEWPVVQTYGVKYNTPLYELAYKWNNKNSYKDVITKYGRPMYEIRTMGPVTLTHGSP